MPVLANLWHTMPCLRVHSQVTGFALPYLGLHPSARPINPSVYKHKAATSMPRHVYSHPRPHDCAHSHLAGTELQYRLLTEQLSHSLHILFSLSSHSLPLSSTTRYGAPMSAAHRAQYREILARSLSLGHHGRACPPVGDLAPHAYVTQPIFTSSYRR